MNMKKQVFDYMSNNPGATTADLVAVFPKAKKKSLWNYSREWKKDRGIQPANNLTSIRQRVFSFINQNPDATQKDLQKAFPEANKVSISNYHYQWRKSQPNRKKKKSVKTIVFSYLDSHPSATYRELRNALEGINPSSISAYHSIWKQSQSGQKTQKQKSKKQPPDLQSSPVKEYVDKSPQVVYSGHSAKELIDALKTTIKSQETVIEVMREQNVLLRKSQPELLSDLQGISSKEWQQLRKVIAMFIKGLKSVDA